MTDTPASTKCPALLVRGLTKRFAGETALIDVDFSVQPGEVHGLLGQNGSGKSTLIKVLAGFHEPEPGAHLEIHGEPVELPLSPADPRRLGIAFVHQHLALLPSLTVLENLRLSRFATERRMHVNWAAEHRSARALFDRFDLSLDTSAPVASLTQTQRAMLAIVRAFDDLHAGERSVGHGIMILDEPTPFLPRAGVQQLFELIRAVTSENACVIFVSHDIDEIREITDRATILRDGSVAGTITSAGATHEEVVELIVGRQVERYRTARTAASEKPVKFSVEGLAGRVARDVSFTIGEGEILGLTGLIGSGFDEIPYLLFGAQPAAAGLIRSEGETTSLQDLTPGAAMQRNFALLPADRLDRSGVARLSVMENEVLPVFDEFFHMLRLDWRAIKTRSRELNDLLDVRPRLAGLPAMNLGSLSGGNQQKALLAKWLQTNPKLLLLDEPTQGVDVGARQTLLEQLGKAAAAGSSVVCASTDAEQLAQICDRVLVFARGNLVAELTGDEVTKETITERSLLSGSHADRTNKVELAK